MSEINGHRQYGHVYGFEHDYEDHERHHSHERSEHANVHGKRSGIVSTIVSIFNLGGHTHEHGNLAHDNALKDNELGIRTVYTVIALLGLTTVFQIGIYLVSGSVALLGDTVHNIGDALISIPLLFAFWLAIKKANKRYTYGYGRAEDLAGLFIVLTISLSAFFILWESLHRLFNPVPLDNLGLVAVAAFIGFAGNAFAALIQIRTGKKMGSDALIANGTHSQTDGLTSLAILVAVIGAWFGYPIIDAIIGIVMGIIILFIAKDSAKSMWYKLMDAVDPTIVKKAERIIREHPDVKGIQRLQMRWIGHHLQVEAVLSLNTDLNTAQCNSISEHLSHHLYHDIPNLSETTIAMIPWSIDGKTFHYEASHHRSYS